MILTKKVNGNLTHPFVCGGRVELDWNLLVQGYSNPTEVDPSTNVKSSLKLGPVDRTRLQDR